MVVVVEMGVIENDTFACYMQVPWIDLVPGCAVL
jgi:hypothetical protein